VIQPKEMQSILWDVMRAETLASEMARKDSSVDVAIETKSLSQKVFNIHKTDSARFNKSYNWYVKHPDLLKIIFDSLYSQKERENNLHLRKKNVPDSLVK
jgi:predicted neuraminidase